VKIPKKITPCPIVESIVEIRFDSKIPDEAVFGVLYSGFQDEYKKYDKLPILQLPDAIRSSDPNLRYKAHYRLKNENYVILIGPKVFSFCNIKNYVGWDVFSPKIVSTFDILSKLNAIKKISRFGLRYINVIPSLNIYEKSKLIVSLDEQNLSKNEINLTAKIESGKFKLQLTMANNASVSMVDQKDSIKGSLIDIDVMLEETIAFDSIEKLTNEAHNEEKKLFFSLLSSDYLGSLNPEY